MAAAGGSRNGGSIELGEDSFYFLSIFYFLFSIFYFDFLFLFDLSFSISHLSFSISHLSFGSVCAGRLNYRFVINDINPMTHDHSQMTNDQ